MMRAPRRWLALSATGAACLTLVVTAAGCSKSADSSTSSSSAISSAAPSSPSAAKSDAADSADGPAQLTVDGQPANVAGAVVCSTTDGTFSIAVGDLGTGYIVGLEPDGSVVHNVGLPIMDNGLVLAYTEGVPGNEATATKDGNTYTITGTVTGTDNANTQVSKPFEIVATCP